MTEIDLAGSYQGLECPACGNANLHHGEVTVYMRGEDNPETTEVRTNGETGETIVSTTRGKGNPSSRRDGITIQFTCEHCNVEPMLTIAQHKGATFIEWRRGDDVQG